MSSDSVKIPQPPASDQPKEFRKKNGEPSKMRSHAGNIPVLPQTKLCPHCPAKFTRTTHLNRHLRTHTNERMHRCDMCGSQFTRSDLLTRHKKSCSDQRPRRKSCIACTESKIKCDRKFPCDRCTARGKECVFSTATRRSGAPFKPSAPPLSESSTSYSGSSTHSSTSSPKLDALKSGSIPIPIVAPPEHFPFDDYSYTENVSSFFGDDLTVSASEIMTETEIPVTNSHLAAVYNNDIFAPFFSSIFAETTAATQQPPVLVPTDPRSFLPENFDTREESPDDFTHGMIQLPADLDITKLPPQTHHVAMPPDDFQTHALNDPDEHSDEELQHYLYLGFSLFLTQMPVVHLGTFRTEGKSELLLNALRASGALFLKTRKAALFISRTLRSSRDLLVHEFAKNPIASEVVELIQAAAILQTIGLFHQVATERASSTVYHGMLIMMIRRSNLVPKSGSWRPKDLGDAPPEVLWTTWAYAESIKRALIMSFLHDCCQMMFFAGTPSYHPSEVALYLPCENALWDAPSATDWLEILQKDSLYGDIPERLTGVNMLECLATLSQPRQLVVPPLVTPYGLFVLAHAILGRIFEVCKGSSKSKHPIAGATEPDPEQAIYMIQFALHNWLQCWIHSPDVHEDCKDSTASRKREPPFLDYALPFYWLAQVSLLAYQEGIPPFNDSPNNIHPDVRYKLVKGWLKHIRSFLKSSDDAPTLLWDDLMKIRLQAWQMEADSEVEDPDGLIGFFEKIL